MKQYNICSVEKCERAHDAHGYCHMHYQRVRRTGETGSPETVQTKPPADGLCSLNGCNRKHESNGYCNMHRQRVRTTGKTGSPETMRTKLPADGLCSVAGCNNKPDARGYCSMHYQRVRATGEIEPANNSYVEPRPCLIVGCTLVSLTVSGCCVKHKNRLRTYGLTVDQFNAMTIAHAGTCAICGDSESSVGMLHIDHDHVTGRVRGLLCRACNLGIGKLKDNAVIVQAAADYLVRAAD